jgi:hypothetical protein
MSQDTLLHRKTLFVIPTTDSDHITLPFFTHSISSNFGGYLHLTESTTFALIIHFNEFLTASGWEGDIELHIGAVLAKEAPQKGEQNQIKY